MQKLLVKLYFLREKVQNTNICETDVCDWYVQKVIPFPYCLGKASNKKNNTA